MKGKGKGELRFKVGDRVQCRTGQGWLDGTIVKQWYREPRFPPGQYAPYQVKLDVGSLIFAPMDDDKVVRGATGLLAEGKIPVTVLTGFLGAGKTTLLNYILKAQHGKRYAVIENEIGAVGVDNVLLEGYNKRTEENITLLDNGCLCCTVRGDLIDAIKGIVKSAQERLKEGEGKSLDGILIETTGMADPGPICKTFYGDDFAMSHCKIDGVITVVDAVHFIEQLTRERSEGTVNESAQQVAYADKVLLNKVDAASPEKLQDTLDAIRGVNYLVPITQCSLGKKPDAIPIGDLLGIDAFDLGKLAEEGDALDLSVCGEVRETAPQEEQAAGGHGHGGGHGHEDCGDKDCGHGHDGGHGHGHECSDSCDHGDGGHGNAHGHSHKAKFRHDSGVGSFVCEVKDKALDQAKFNEFLSALLEAHAVDLYRYKGIVAMKRSGVSQFVLQGVHEMCELTKGDAWPADKPFKSQVVLIGRNLPSEKWQGEFAKCAL